MAEATIGEAALAVFRHVGSTEWNRRPSQWPSKPQNGFEGPGHAFANAVGQFVRVLATVPDCRPIELSSDAVSLLKTVSGGAIERIEQRVSTKDESSSGQVELVNAACDIRRELEEIDLVASALPQHGSLTEAETPQVRSVEHYSG
jgi:hypothetical protein